MAEVLTNLDSPASVLINAQRREDERQEPHSLLFFKAWEVCLEGVKRIPLPQGQAPSLLGCLGPVILTYKTVGRETRLGVVSPGQVGRTWTLREGSGHPAQGLLGVEEVGSRALRVTGSRKPAKETWPLSGSGSSALGHPRQGSRPSAAPPSQRVDRWTPSPGQRGSSGPGVGP